jgi:hypothetical protein
METSINQIKNIMESITIRLHEEIKERLQGGQVLEGCLASVQTPIPPNKEQREKIHRVEEGAEIQMKGI